MFNEKVYTDYLVKKKTNTEDVNKNINILKQLFKLIKNNTSIQYFTEDNINKSVNYLLDSSLNYGATEYHNYIDILTKYINYVKQEIENNDFLFLVNNIEKSLIKRYEDIAKQAVKNRRENILLIPNDAYINPKHLREITNNEFILSFRQLQQIIINTYSDIEKSPFYWGYPDCDQTDGYYNRVTDFLFAFVFNGTYENDILTVNKKEFLSDKRIKIHKKIEQMILGFNNMGFSIEGFDKKSISFTVKYPNNPYVIYVLNVYINEIPKDKPNWLLGMPRLSFSYRFIEDPNKQKYETIFISELDYQSKKLQDIQYFLHKEAAKMGYKIDINEWREKGCILYKKGAKRFMLVGEYKKDGLPVITSKIIFRGVFDKEKEKMEDLYLRFPDTFKSNCTLCNGSKPFDGECSMRISYVLGGKSHCNCAYNSFRFYNIELNDVKDLLNLFIIENKIK